MVEEEYAQDLYNIGIILLISPIIGMGIALLGAGFGVILGGSLEFSSPDTGIYAINCQMLAGFLIMVYIAWKYYYKKAVKGKV